MTLNKHSLSLLALAFSLALMASCGKKPQPADNRADVTPAAMEVADQIPDSTLYGVGGEFGMSTFTLITEKGDTLNVTRTALDGTDGEVYGSLREGDRYAMTTRDNGEAIGVLINLTELEHKVKKFDVVNGHVVAEGDTLQLDKLL